MLKYLGIGLMGVFAMMVIPASLDIQENETAIYGMGHMVLKDAFGNILLESSIHNRVVDDGENFLLQQTFADGTAPVGDVASIGMICVTDNTGTTSLDLTPSETNFPETLHAADFDASEGYTNITTICKELADGGVTVSSGVATFAAIEFSEGTHVGLGEKIALIAICQKNNNNTHSDDVTDCGSGGVSNAGILFAIFDNSPDVQLNSGETVDITYSFDISADEA